MKHYRLRRAGIALLAAASVSLTACGSDSSSSSTGGQSIAIAISGGTLSLAQGASGNVTVTVTRSSFTGAVTLSATGMPSGVTAPDVTVPADQAQGTLAFTTTSAASVGTSTITIHASGTGVTAVTKTLSLTVTAATGTGGFTISSAPAALSVLAGANGTSTVTINRTGTFTGAVNLTATTPAGVTATFAPASVTGTTSTLTLAVAASVVAGPLTITVKGDATGQTQQTASLTLTVTVSGGGSGNVSFSFCGQSGIPVLVAAQDGTGAWTAVTGTSNVFSTTISSSKGGVAYVVPSTNGGFDTEVFFGTATELNTRGANVCNGTVGAGKTVTGNVSGTVAGDIAFITLGRSQASPAGGATTFTLNNVLPGTLDLVATKSSLNLQTLSLVPNSIVIQRGLNVVAGGSAGTVNFATGVAPATATLTANNLGTDNLTAFATYLTANNTSAALYTGGTSATATQTWFGVPAASQVAGDMHLLFVQAAAVALPIVQTRQAIVVSTAVTAKTITLGAPLAAPTVTVAATVPVVRLKLDHTAQTDYNQFFQASFQQLSGTAAERLANVQMTAGYAGGTAVSLVVPDLSTVAGWSNSFGMTTGVAATWTLSATGGSAGFFSANPFTDGAVFTAATRLGTITP